ncbi:unnamed protein product [Blepharisma stoltei]|uniref:Uncharacterized protein n=1 Tax=Blepharisma stoltei TaxID=1481888 RepID=A0AAU9JFR4_9CILI|nr:unnamed protein product [Blepharisma stoltei]
MIILHLGFSGLGILLTVPALVQEYIDDNDFSKWQNSIKILPHLLLMVSCALRFNKIILPFGLVMGVITWISNHFLFILNLTSSSTSICEDFSDLCTEDTSSCINSPVSSWAGILYIIGLLFMIIGNTLLIKNTGDKILEINKLVIG